MHVGSPRRIHHVNCGSFRPWRGTTLVTHVLVIELDHGIALVDTGMGTADCAHPARLGWTARATRAVFDTADTAVAHIERLGFAATDVTDIVVTHMDFDHISGVADFPGARLHATVGEFRAATRRTDTIPGRLRYKPAHLRNMLDVNTYGRDDTEVLGEPARSLRGLDGVFLVPMPGHTAGHAAVAVDDPDRGWLVHAGDAFMDPSRVVGETQPPSPRLRAAEWVFAVDLDAVSDSRERLRRMVGSGARVFCSHDARQLRELQQETDRLVRRECAGGV
ncbi:MBL fold metallo-hydrolase [Rhodococcoides kroppenstedtii]|uniref:MBL fold metallo-hydrolase n=1 Tax=Rhodococcoides kroppenstedtii TaxID=293050 RepID=UPI00362AAFDD